MPKQVSKTFILALTVAPLVVGFGYVTNRFAIVKQINEAIKLIEEGGGKVESNEEKIFYYFSSQAPHTVTLSPHSKNQKEQFAGLRHFQKLENLYARGCDVADDDLKHLSRMKQLKTVDLAATLVTDDGMQRLADLPSLESLNLSLTFVSDRGVKLLPATVEIIAVASKVSVNSPATNVDMICDDPYKLDFRKDKPGTFRSYRSSQTWLVPSEMRAVRPGMIAPPDDILHLLREIHKYTLSHTWVTLPVDGSDRPFTAVICPTEKLDDEGRDQLPKLMRELSEISDVEIYLSHKDHYISGSIRENFINLPDFNKLLEKLCDVGLYGLHVNENITLSAEQLKMIFDIESLRSFSLFTALANEFVIPEHLRHLRITEHWSQIKLIEFSGLDPSLKYLEIIGMPYCGLSCLAPCRQLTTLYMYARRKPCDYSPLGDLPSLTNLTIENCHYKFDPASLAHCKSLQSLVIKFNHVRTDLIEDVRLKLRNLLPGTEIVVE